MSAALGYGVIVPDARPIRKAFPAAPLACMHQRRRITRRGDGAVSRTLYDPLRYSNRTNS